MTRAYRRRSTIGNIEQRGKRFRIRWTDESKTPCSESGFLTYRAADERLLEIQADVSAPLKRRTWSWYYSHMVEPTFKTLKPKTSYEYRRQWRHDLQPLIGESMVCSTDWRLVQSVMDELPTESVQRHSFSLLRKMCGMAVRDGLLRSNPCDRSIRFKSTPKRAKCILDANGVLELLSCVQGSKYEPLVLVMLGCGLRVEEAMALTWDDLDDVKVDGVSYMKIDVSKALVTVGGKAQLMGSTKNEVSTRTAILGEPFAQRLREIAGNGHICANKDGFPTSPSTVSKNWGAWLRRHDMPHVPMADMRSIYATLACECADSSLVSLSMGHSDGTTRGRNYQQATIRGLAIVADAYEDYLYRFAQEMPTNQNIPRSDGAAN